MPRSTISDMCFGALMVGTCKDYGQSDTGMRLGFFLCNSCWTRLFPVFQRRAWMGLFLLSRQGVWETAIGDLTAGHWNEIRLGWTMDNTDTLVIDIHPMSGSIWHIDTPSTYSRLATVYTQQ